MQIHKLLNPSFADRDGYRDSSPIPASLSRPVASIVVPKRQKVPKDAPIFSEGNNIVGYVNFPPHEARDDHDLKAQHQKFQVYPLGEIYKKGIRHIPYNSDKKDFLDKTGRDAFEMFQYTYKRPGDEKEYVVVWDYNVGLVRMTPFFKSLKYSKTMPAKALRENPGLKDISYSITGGALVCQGYWIPYHAAKAIATTFCHEIRWALTPVFGNDFPSLCLHPKDPNFAKFLIDPAIVKYCALETIRFRTEGPSYRVLNSSVSSPVETPTMPFGSPLWKEKGTKQRHVWSADVESGYGTDTDQSDKCHFSPQVSPRGQGAWTSVNMSQSPSSPRTANSSTMGSPVSTRGPPVLIAATSVPGGYYDEPFQTKRTLSKVAFSDTCDGDTLSRPQTAATIDSDGGDEVHSRGDIDAAEMLLSLSAADKRLPPPKRTRRGSKY
ncbi:DNA-binding domain of Mlu1-box binding protein MBP1 [Cucurbitaria berberidis CBS 394.84]|uniref:DNA-binding domain of Mlu1-box binding protein MBP1 n=1 Tax=Cucurbitaria berberidis CBS 394.84 TaxID=1168544 RepID=A0A9P4L7U5_9PLEO|nr:DNA-binding domain of Mlu1-box binding protein MBP1 [Cucurbitaria berberidis CBS 394.84]KAF1845376.1 DNA-binding domain of Mlu1-box binding protein MBP1 [Cucurbitaria berberidis CBS 394.84]